MKKFLTAFALTLVFYAVLTGTIKAQQTTPIFQVLTPKEGQTLYGNKLPILFNVESFQLAEKEQTQIVPGEGHILLWLDETAPTVENATKVSENSFIYSDVTYGHHTLKAELVTSDNKSLTPPLQVSVSFTTEILPSEEETAISSGFDKTTAIVILAVVALVILAAWWYTKDEDDEMGEESETSKPKKQASRKTTKKKSVKRKK